MQQPEKVTFLTKLYVHFTHLHSFFHKFHSLTFSYSQIHNKKCIPKWSRQDRLGATPRTKDASYQGLTTSLRFFLFGNDELGFGQISYTLQESTVVYRAVLCSSISLTAASINRRLLLTIYLFMFVFMME